MRWSAISRLVFLAVSLAVVHPVRAEGEEKAIVLKAVSFLRAQGASSQVGETALAGLALVKAETPTNDPAVVACLKKVMTRFSTSVFTPERPGPGGASIYEAAVVIMFLANLDPVAHKANIDAAAQYLISNQLAGGCWDYNNRKAGDASISQYAVLGLWEAENAGSHVPAGVWDRAAKWYLSVQDGAGGWCYHRDENSQDTVSMTAAGIGSLLICKRQLEPHRKAAESKHALLAPVAVGQDTPGAYKPNVSDSAINAAVTKGIGWLVANFSFKEPIIGSTPFYGLYGLERVGALADKDTLGRTDWYAMGLNFISSKQQGDGSCNANFGAVPNTAWAVLFSTKSTAKTIRKIQIKRLGAGTLIGGRDLPKDLTSMTIAGGRVLARPMNGAVEGMLAVLEDPRAENADGALSGLIAKYQTGGPAALKPFQDRFRKLLTDRDPGIRSAAAWALARTGDLDVVPDLIKAMTDPDDAVVEQARWGLQLLSRKIDGFGPVRGAPLPARQEAARKWKAWYDDVVAAGERGPTRSEKEKEKAPASK